MKDFLYFTRTERNGLLVLITFCFLGFITPTLYSYFTTKEIVDFSAFEVELKAFQAQQEDLVDHQTERQYTLFPFDPNTASDSIFLQLGIPPATVKTILNYRKKGGRFFAPSDFKKIYGLEEDMYETLAEFIQIQAFEKRKPKPKASLPSTISQPISLFPFDPNTITEEELQQLGLKDKTIQIWNNFRKKGGKFYQKEDVAKIYGLSKSTYENLYPYINIPEPSDSPLKTSKTTPPPIAKKSKPPIIIHVNKASQEDWQQLRGIGPYRARMIVKYREKLGGFAHLTQLSEIQQIPDSILQQILPQLLIEHNPQQLNINSASIKQLSAHPYLTYKQSKVIVNYRAHHGNFADLSDLAKVKVLDDSMLQKLLPYLNFD